MSSFLPRTDQGKQSWGQNAVAVITPNATALGVPAPVLTSFTAVVNGFVVALAACEPGVRSKSSVLAKNSARLAFTIAAGNMSKLIQSNPAVSDSMKAEIGLNVRATPQRRPIPALPPGLDVRSVVRNTATIGLHGEAGGRRGKPALVAAAQVYSYVGANPPTDSNDWLFQGSCTRVAKVEVAFDASLPMGTKAWICAAWANERGQPGPACDPVGVVLLGSGALPSAGVAGEGLSIAA